MYKTFAFATLGSVYYNIAIKFKARWASLSILKLVFMFLLKCMIRKKSSAYAIHFISFILDNLLKAM